MSRSSNGRLRRQAAAAGIGVAASLFAYLSFSASDVAILATGPNTGRGLPYFSANVMSYYAATYDAPAHSASPITVYFTSARLTPYSQWRTTTCGDYALLQIPDDPPALLYTQGGTGEAWSILIQYPQDYQQPCGFASQFLTRFTYFLGITGNAPLSSFPAVLQLGS